MPRVPTVHHALSGIDSAADDIDLLSDVRLALHGSRVYAHSNAQLLIAAKSGGDLDSTSNRRKGIAHKSKSQSVPSGKRNQLLSLFGALEFGALPHDRL